MISISVKHDLAGLTRWLNDLQRKHVPFATALALTRTADKVITAEYAEMRRVFDRPTPFTLNSLRKIPATKTKLVAYVFPKDLGQYRKHYEELDHYLYPQIMGGPRSLLGFEKYLRRAGKLPFGMFVVPGERAELDKYGNFKRSQWVKILSAVGAAEHSAGYDANRTVRSVRTRGIATKKRKGKLIEYFVGRPKPGKPLGVWQRVGPLGRTALRPILIFTRAPHYRRRFLYQEVGNRVTAAEFPGEFRRSLSEALAGAAQYNARHS